MLAALISFATIALAVRILYPRYVERHAQRSRVVGPDGIVVGAATIDLRREGAPGALLVHGGGDTPQVLAELATYLHARGFAVRVPLLTGHGRSVRDLAKVTSAEWHNDVQRHFDSMAESHECVGVIGLSLGGALAVDLAAERAGVSALVLLAPYVLMPSALRAAAGTSTLWGAFWPYFSSGGGGSIHDPVAASKALGDGVLTPAALRALAQAAKDAERALPRVRTPTLVIQSRQDNRLTTANAEITLAKLGAAEKKLVWIEGAGHVITVDFGHQRVFDLCAEWLQNHCRTNRAHT